MVQYPRQLDSGFAALSDPTRRGVLERLGRGDASITDLAERFGMTLTGMKKFHTTEERDGMLHSGMEGGLNQSYAALDAVLARMTP